MELLPLLQATPTPMATVSVPVIYTPVLPVIIGVFALMLIYWAVKFVASIVTGG